MDLVKVMFDGTGYGYVHTSLPPTGKNRDEPLIRIEVLEMEPLAMLAADLLGEEQPYTRHEVRNLVRWFYPVWGEAVWGTAVFARVRPGVDLASRYL